ncbi:MAG: hypothetical protein ACYTGM_08955 [Planctomycetota bacterium]
MVLALVAGCGSADDEPAAAIAVTADAPIQHRLFRGPADQQVIDQLDVLRDEPGRKLASWTFSSPDDAEAFEAKGVIAAASVQDGASQPRASRTELSTFRRRTMRGGSGPCTSGRRWTCRRCFASR